jgi:putative acetyltransferase
VRVSIRAEREGDKDAIYGVHAAAFETSLEARLADALRERARPVVSLVAEADAGIVGHVLFSPVALTGRPSLRLMGLAPMSVVPSYQRQGIGSALVTEGLVGCRELGAGAVVVLGHPRYYPRFGFVPSSRFGISSEYDVAEDVFMVLELAPGCLCGATGTICYPEAFGELGA